MARGSKGLRVMRGRARDPLAVSAACGPWELCRSAFFQSSVAAEQADEPDSQKASLLNSIVGARGLSAALDPLRIKERGRARV